MKKNKRTLIELIILAVVICAGSRFVLPKAAIILNNLAVSRMKKGQAEQAMRFYKTSLKLFPTPQAHFNLACAYEKNKDYAQAMTQYREALKINPQFKEAFYGIYDIYFEHKRFADAKKILEEYADLLGGDAGKERKYLKRHTISSLYNEAANAYNNQGKKHEAIEKLKKIIELAPDFILAYKAIADIYSNHNQFSQAMPYYEQAAALGLNDAQVFNNLGIAYMHKEDYPQAVFYLKKAHILEPDDPDIMYNLASTLRDNRNLQEAVTLYLRLAQRVPDYPNLHNDLGAIYELLGEKEQAAQEFTRELNILNQELSEKGWNDFKRERMALAWCGLGQPEKALKIINEVIQHDPQQKSAFYARAQIFRKLGRFQEAEQDMGRAQGVVPPYRIFKPVVITTQKLAGQEESGIDFKNKKAEKDAVFVEDTRLFLKNGGSLRGRIIKETEDKIVLRVKTGDSCGNITLRRSAIRTIEKLR